MLKPIFVRPRAFTILSSGNARAEKPASHLEAIDTIGMVWGSNGNTNLNVVGDMGSAKEINFAAMISANAVAGTLWRLRLATSVANLTALPDYDSGNVSFISPAITREDGLYHSFLQLPSIQTRRYFRIDITGHTGDFEASTIVIGSQLASLCFSNPEWSHEIEDLGGIEISRFGVASVTEGLIFRRFGMTLGWMTFADYENGFRPFIENRATRRPVYLCFDPQATTFRQSNTFLGWFQKSPVARGGKVYNKYTADFEVLSFI